MDAPMRMDRARNLVDFNDVRIGKDGRVYVAYSDGWDNCTQPWHVEGRGVKGRAGNTVKVIVP